MDWKVVCFGTMMLWGFYIVFASLAISAHGERVTMGVEALAMLSVGIGMMFLGGFADMGKVTRASLFFAVAMGACSAVGLMLQFYAFRVAPPNQQGTVAMVTGLFPVVACVLFALMHRLHLAGGVTMSFRQWLGIATGAMTLWLISGK